MSKDQGSKFHARECHAQENPVSEPLYYVGQGDFIYGVPARNLTAEEVEACGGAERLIATGLYIRLEALEDNHAKPSVEEGPTG